MGTTWSHEVAAAFQMHKTARNLQGLTNQGSPPVVFLAFVFSVSVAVAFAFAFAVPNPLSSPHGTDPPTGLRFIIVTW
jgi:hypothetical protein